MYVIEREIPNIGSVSRKRPSAGLIPPHAAKSGFPDSTISEVKAVIDSTTAEG